MTNIEMRNELLKSYEKNGTPIDYEGKTYHFTRLPYIDGPVGEPYFICHMVCGTDDIDEDGCIPVYTAVWNVLPDWDEEDESYACDWEAPESIEEEPYGICVADGHIV